MLGRWKCIGGILYTRKKEPAPKGRFKRFAESVAVSSTTPVDFPISALADFLVRPLGAASTYFRAALGALGNLGGAQGSCKGSPRRKTRSLRIFNNQHFHSRSCSLWISVTRRARCGRAPRAGARSPGCGRPRGTRAGPEAACRRP